MNEINTEKFMHDMRAVVIDAEDLLKATAGQAGERVDKVRARAEESLRLARERLLAAGEDLEGSARNAAREVNEEVKAHPWATAGLAAGVGLLVGLLVGRR
jgi:ElaB/YqjD/DUF883 family membrane-anchored ribosome-binding protein